MTGKIVRLMQEKGFGFIQGENRLEYFFHRTSLKNARFDELEQGQDVTFEDAEGDKGLRAEDVYV